MAGLPDPQPGYRWVLEVPEAAPRRRSPWPWIIAFVLVAGLVVVAWFAGEWIARGLVERTIRTQVVDSLGLPADQQIDVVVDGAVLPQLITGSLDEVHVASEDVAFGSFAGDISVEARGIPIRGDGPVDAASATVSMDEAQLRTLLSTVDGFPEETIGLADPDVTMSVELTFFGLAIPIGVGLTPGAAEGDITLTPASLRLGEASVTADELRSRFGSIADGALRTWDICIAEYLPQGLTLSTIEVDGDRVVADIAIDGGIITDTSLQEPGSC